MALIICNMASIGFSRFRQHQDLDGYDYVPSDRLVEGDGDDDNDADYDYAPAA